MDDHNTIHHQENIHQPETEGAEEALSLSDLPLNVDEPEKNQCHSQSSAEPENDFFGFLNNLDSEMSHAEDIFFCGRIVPWKDQALLGDDSSRKVPFTDDGLKGVAQRHRRRCESLSELKTIDRSSSTKTRLVRSCRSLDYRKLRRNGSLSFRAPPGFLRALSDKSSEKPGDSSSVLKVSSSSKPRWYELMFGLVRFPQEMDLQEIKNRQIRRKPGTMFQLFENGQKSPVNHQNDRKSSWGLLRVLSCKNHASVPVTASISYVPQV